MLAVCAANVENFTDMVRNSAGKRDFVVSASIEMCTVPRGTTECQKASSPLGKECGCESHRKWFLGHLFRCLGGYVAGLGL